MIQNDEFEVPSPDPMNINQIYYLRDGIDPRPI